jgi:hypothetical protein
VTGGATAGSSRAFRLDPFALPMRHPVSFDGGATAFVLDRKRVIVRRPVRGQTMTLAVPISAYRGVAVRIVPAGQTGDIRVTVELMHRDPALTLPLVVADEPEDVAADWQAWGRALNLPLLLVAEDGTVKTPVDRLGGLVVSETKPRRRHSFFADRRPRFLTRRKVGHKGEQPRITGREIIARN